jgi:hypothetical protein
MRKGDLDSSQQLSDEFWRRPPAEYRNTLTRMQDIEILCFEKNSAGKFELKHDFEPGKLVVLRTHNPKIVCYRTMADELQSSKNKLRFNLTKMIINQIGTADNKSFKLVTGPAASLRLTETETAYPLLPSESLVLFERHNLIVCIRFSEEEGYSGLTSSQCYKWKSALLFVAKSLDPNFKGYTESIDDKFREHLAQMKQQLDQSYSLLFKLSTQDYSNSGDVEVTILGAYLVNYTGHRNFIVSCKFLVLDMSHKDIEFTLKELYSHLENQFWIQLRKGFLDSLLAFFTGYKQLKLTHARLRYEIGTNAAAQEDANPGTTMKLPCYVVPHEPSPKKKPRREIDEPSTMGPSKEIEAPLKKKHPKEIEALSVPSIERPCPKEPSKDVPSRKMKHFNPKETYAAVTEFKKWNLVKCR